MPSKSCWFVGDAGWCRVHAACSPPAISAAERAERGRHAGCALAPGYIHRASAAARLRWEKRTARGLEREQWGGVGIGIPGILARLVAPRALQDGSIPLQPC